nr:hypothetical protein [Gluconacetobacter tumulisoli]
MPFAVSGHAGTVRQPMSVGNPAPMPPMSGMAMASAMAHMHVDASQGGHGHHHHPCHRAGDCCLQGACMANWIVPPFMTRVQNPVRATVLFGLHPAARVAGVAFAPDLPPPRQTA